MPLSRSDRIIASIFIPLITLPLIYLVLNFVQQIISPPISNIFETISYSFLSAFIEFHIFSFIIIIPIIFKLILILLSYLVLSTKRVTALILIIPIILIILALISSSILVGLNHQTKEITILNQLTNLIWLPILPLFSICWVSLTGYQNLKDLTKKIILPTLVLLFLITPALIISINLREIIAKNGIISVHRPKYLPKQVNITYHEATSGGGVDWWYSCSLNGDKTSITGSFFISMQKLGEQDITTREKVSLESTLNYHKKFLEDPNHTSDEFIKDVKINNQPGFIHHKSNDYYLYWTTLKSLVRIWTTCPGVDEQELLRTAESM